MISLTSENLDKKDLKHRYLRPPSSPPPPPPHRLLTTATTTTGNSTSSSTSVTAGVVFGGELESIALWMATTVCSFILLVVFAYVYNRFFKHDGNSEDDPIADGSTSRQGARAGRRRRQRQQQEAQQQVEGIYLDVAKLQRKRKLLESFRRCSVWKIVMAEDLVFSHEDDGDQIDYDDFDDDDYDCGDSNPNVDDKVDEDHVVEQQKPNQQKAKQWQMDQRAPHRADTMATVPSNVDDEEEEREAEETEETDESKETEREEAAIQIFVEDSEERRNKGNNHNMNNMNNVDTRIIPGMIDEVTEKSENTNDDVIPTDVVIAEGIVDEKALICNPNVLEGAEECSRLAEIAGTPSFSSTSASMSTNISSTNNNDANDGNCSENENQNGKEMMWEEGNCEYKANKYKKVPAKYLQLTPTRRVSNLCAICLDAYNAGDGVVWSSNVHCRHAFHLECILDWLVNHVTISPANAIATAITRQECIDDSQSDSTPCPCCRQEFTDLDVQRRELYMAWRAVAAFDSH